MTAQPNSRAVVLSEDLKNPAMEKLDLVRKWSINTYKVNLSLLDLLLCPFFNLLLLLPFVNWDVGRVIDVFCHFRRYCDSTLK